MNYIRFLFFITQSYNYLLTRFTLKKEQHLIFFIRLVNYKNACYKVFK